MQVGDIIIARGKVFRVSGIYLGGVGTQNIVGLVSISQAKGYAHGYAVDEMFVPEEIVLTADTYRRVD